MTGSAAPARQLPIFRALGGAAADVGLRRWALETVGDAESLPYMFTVLSHAPDVLDAETRNALYAAAREQPIAHVFALHNALPILGRADDVGALAMQRATSTDEAWWDVPLPPVAVEAALVRLARLTRSTDDKEFARLVARLKEHRVDGDRLAALVEARLAYAADPEAAQRLALLAAHGRSREVVLDLALAWLCRRPKADLTTAWQGDYLASRSGWDAVGTRVVEALVDENPNVLGAVVLRADQTARRAESTGGPSTARGVLDAMHIACARALIRRAEGAPASGDVPRATRALSALACLAPPARIWTEVRCLRDAPNRTRDVDELIDGCAALFRRDRDRRATG